MSTNDEEEKFLYKVDIITNNINLFYIGVAYYGSCGGNKLCRRHLPLNLM